MTSYRKNLFDQAIEIAGSLTQSDTFTISDEPLMLGGSVGITGAAATVGAIGANNVVVSGLSGMTPQSLGNILQISGAASSGNNGAFYIDGYISPTSVTIVNPNAVSPDTNNGSLIWTERREYVLEEDMNYNRTNVRLIKGSSFWYSPIPTYQRPNAIGTLVDANLTNISGKTTDAVSYNVTRSFYNQSVAATNTLITISSTGNLKHSDSVNNIGIPVFDAAPFIGDYTSSFVLITDGYGIEPHVLTGAHAGEKIFGLTYAGASTSPDSVEVRFFSVAGGGAINGGTVTAYAWEAGQSTSINLGYGYNERLDQLDVNAFRTIPTLGLISDAALEQDVNNLQSTVGVTDGYSSLANLLTNASTFYPFFNLPNATPTVVDALNVLNTQIGNRNYTGLILTPGQTITASLQALANSITNSSVVRTIERLSSPLLRNTPHTLPAGLTYNTDNTNNAQHMWVFARGALRDPGLASDSNDYSEVDNSTILFYFDLKAGDHINYFIKS